MHTFRLSWFAAVLAVLICILSFCRCESFTASAEGSSKNEIAVEEEDGNSGDKESGSGSNDEPETEEDLYFYLFDKESMVTEYKAPSDNEAKDEPDFLYNPQPGHIRIVEFYAQ